MYCTGWLKSATLPCGALTRLFRLLDTQNEALRAPRPTLNSFADPPDINEYMKTAEIFNPRKRSSAFKRSYTVVL
jgi:hypothetical protein